MKKYLILGLLLLLAACGQAVEEQPSGTDYAYPEYILETREGFVYPSFFGIDASDEVNATVQNFIEELGTTSDFQIGYYSGELLSIRFEGESTAGAYPRKIVAGLNIDLTTGQAISLEDVILGDYGILAELIAGEVTEQWQELGADTGAEPLTTADDVLAVIGNSYADGFSFYIDNYQIAFIFDVVHALDDVIVIYLPVNEIADYNQLILP